MVNLIAVTTLLLRPIYIAASKEHLRRIQSIFVLLKSSFHYLFCLKFSFKLVTFSQSYARKHKWVFFFWTSCTTNSHVLSTTIPTAIVNICSMQINEFWPWAIRRWRETPGKWTPVNRSHPRGFPDAVVQANMSRRMCKRRSSQPTATQHRHVKYVTLCSAVAERPCDVMLRVCQYSASTVQYVDRSHLLLVTWGSDLSLRTIKFCSVVFAN